MEAKICIFFLIYLFYTVQAQLVLSGPGASSCGPISSVTIIDNSMSLALANTLRSMILSNFLDSSIDLTPQSYQNSEFLQPCSFVIESVTYSPVIDIFYPTETVSNYDTYSTVFPDYVCPNAYLTEPVAPKVFYTETITSFGPSSLSGMASASELIGLADFFAPTPIAPISFANSPIDVTPINTIPSNSIGLIDFIMPTPVVGGFNEIYVSPGYFNNYNF